METHMTRITLAAHLAALNAEKLAWVAEDPANRWTGLWVEDLIYWAGLGIFTVKDFQRHENETLFWDMYKEVFGVRPRHVNLKDMSDEELEKEIDLLGRMMENEIRREEEWERQEAAYRAEQEAERAARLAEQPEKIDYVACHYQEGWL
jgi:uncharacterized protein with von Willebrand factor type A (vWA) domain